MPQLETTTTRNNLEEKANPIRQVSAEWHDEVPSATEQQYRAAAYSLLAALLRAAPDADRLAQVAGFSQVESAGDEMTLSMSLLGLAAEKCSPDSIADEYHSLFIGLGRGELVPYGSWYLTGFLMEKPLGDLRDDLDRLGFEREQGVHEPEDHIAALCEVMSMLVQEGGDEATQAQFYLSHIDTWCGQFLTDLAAAKNAVFYKAVARFGSAFMEFEKRYLLSE